MVIFLCLLNFMLTIGVVVYFKEKLNKKDVSVVTPPPVVTAPPVQQTLGNMSRSIFSVLYGGK